MRKTFNTTALATVLGVAALALTAANASAAIVCNDDGDCWHVKDKYAYPPAVHLTMHEDNWKWGGQDHYKWNEHEGRGYWKGGVWITF
jgi:hypothetical protein